jgi:hypothetical protein
MKMRYASAVSFFLILCASTVHPQTASQTGASAPVATNVHQIFLADQNDRAGDQLAVETYKRDYERRKQVRTLLAAGQIKTAQDFHDAAYVFQHGTTPDDYLLAHILAVEAVVKGDETSKWISAATLDRYLQGIGRGQVFGTQYSDKRLEGNRAQQEKVPQEKGMTQEPYDRTLVPDALRNSFCVPNLAQQALNLKEFEAGKYPEGIIPPGCTR